MKSARATWWGAGDLSASFALIVPLWLGYDLGLLVAPSANGADLISRGLLWMLSGRTHWYLLVHAAAALGFLLWLHRTHRRHLLSAPVVGRVAAESAIYALTLGVVISLLVRSGLGLGATGGGVLHALVSSVGAGVHEEIIFRLGLFAGGAAVLGQLGFRRVPALLLAALASSLIFAAAHHLGVHGEAFSLRAFTFRAFLGAALAAVMWFRSLAHAVYVHALYDVYVEMVVRA